MEPSSASATRLREISVACKMCGLHMPMDSETMKYHGKPKDGAAVQEADEDDTFAGRAAKDRPYYYVLDF